MSGMLPTDAQDFVFTAPVIDEKDWFSSSPRKPRARGFLIAIALSLTIHMVIFQLNFSLQREPYSSPSQAIHITLDYALSPPKLVEPEAPPQTDIQPEVIEEEIAPSPEVSAMADVEAVQIVPRATVREDLETMIVQQNKYQDDYLPALDSDRAVEHSDSPNERSFGNVFDPRLRARLQSGTTGGVAQQATGPVAFTGIHGSTVVELDSGLCMEANLAASGQPTNWYMTACAGKLSESEQMMERVNNEMRSRRLR